MKLIINGESTQVENVATVKELLEKLGFQIRFIAVAVNGEAILRSAHASTGLKEDDAIEVLSPMQGG